MSYLVVFVLDDIDRSQDVLDAWESAGVNGITIIESTGLGRVRQAGIRDDIPLLPSLPRNLQNNGNTQSHFILCCGRS